MDSPMPENAPSIISALNEATPLKLVIILTFALAFFIVWMFRDRTKDLAELRKAGVDQAPKCAMCKFQVAEVVRRGITEIGQGQQELLERQMKLMDNLVERVTHAMSKNYYDLLRTVKPEMDYDDHEMVVVRMRIKLALTTRVVVGVRRMFKENHLAEKVRPEEWDEYKRVILSTIDADLMEYFIGHYVAGFFSVSRELYYDHFKQEFATLVSLELHQVFDQAKDMAEMYMTEQRNIENRIQQSITSDEPGVCDGGK